MEVIVKKSTELTGREFGDISQLFETVFEKPRSIDLLRRQYEQNPFGFAYLSMLVDDKKLVGLNSYVPSYYIVNGQCKVFANSIDSMVEKPYRDFFNFNDMIRGAYKAMAVDGVSFVYGYPNDNSFPVLTKGKLMREIGRMGIYCLPLHVSGINKRLSFLNPLSALFCRLWVTVSGIAASSKSFTPIVVKDSESYNVSRYKRGDADYSIATLPDGSNAYYKIKNHEGVKTAFLIDVTNKSPKNFINAVKHIVKNHSQEFDLLLYPGWLPFIRTGMIKLPRKFEPKNFYFTGKLLAKKDEIPNEIWKIENWDTNLSNYDLI